MKRIVAIVKEGETAAMRLWFSFVSISFGIFLLSDIHLPEMVIMFSWMPEYVWAVLFVFYGINLFVGLLHKRYSLLSFITEAGFGALLWTVTAWTNVLGQRNIGPSVICALVALWLLYRYPTCYSKNNNKKGWINAL